MEQYLKFEVPGKVKAKQSVKFANIGGFTRKYTPADVKSYANWVRLCFQKTYPDNLPSAFPNDVALRMKINAYFAIPQSFSKKKRDMALEDGYRPTVKPDCDNISKNICDALNGIAFPDDKQIVSLEVNKYYGEVEKVEVIIQQYQFVKK